jgi:hypothetical protein
MNPLTPGHIFIDPWKIGIIASGCRDKAIQFLHQYCTGIDGIKIAARGTTQPGKRFLIDHFPEYICSPVPEMPVFSFHPFKNVTGSRKPSIIRDEFP